MKKFILKLSATFAVMLILLIGIILFPSFLYAKSTVVGNVKIYHNQQLDQDYETVILNSIQLIKASEIFDPQFQLELCLNDGSFYPKLVQFFKGPAFGHGFYNKTVLNAQIEFGENKAYLHNKSWNLTQLIAHEMVHCYQFNKYSFSTLSMPLWKLEGYPEYVVRKSKEQLNLKDNISKLIKATQEGHSDFHWIEFNDGTGTVLTYLKDKLLIQYLIEVEQLSYDQILEDHRSKLAIEKKMMDWFSKTE